MSDIPQNDLTLWLDIAVDGLPRDIRPIVEAELHAHYEDAVADLRAQGVSVEQAHQNALAQMGDADKTGAGLRETHLPERRYMLAALVSLIFPLFAFPAAFLPSWALSDLVLSTITFFPTVYILFAFRGLLKERFNFNLSRYAVLAVCIGVGGFTLPLVASWLFTRHPITIAEVQGTLAGQLRLYRIGIVIPWLIGIGISSMSLLYLSGRILWLKNRLYLLQKPLALMLAFTGIGMAVVLYLILSGQEAIFTFAGLIAQMFYLMANVLWAMIFFFTARNVAREHPMRKPAA